MMERTLAGFVEWANERGHYPVVEAFASYVMYVQRMNDLAQEANEKQRHVEVETDEN